MTWEKAVVDRIEEGLAVLLVGEKEREVPTPLISLPPGVQAGDWLQVELQEGKVLRARLDTKETERRRQRIKAKLKDLLRRSKEQP